MALTVADKLEITLSQTNGNGGGHRHGSDRNGSDRDGVSREDQDDDSDNDGLNDLEETNIHGTNPFNPDTDSDGLSDGSEVANGTNTLLADTDGDTILEGADECPKEPETFNGFSDTDGCPDVTLPHSDTAPPIITCPPPLMLQTESETGIMKPTLIIQQFLASASSSDEIDPDPSMTSDAPDNFPIGATQVIFTATDSSGNPASCISSVQLELTQLPLPPRPQAVGGEILPIDMTALMIAGAFTNTHWIVPSIVGITGAVITVVIFKRKITS